MIIIIKMTFPFLTKSQSGDDATSLTARTTFFLFRGSLAIQLQAEFGAQQWFILVKMIIVVQKDNNHNECDNKNYHQRWSQYRALNCLHCSQSKRSQNQKNYFVYTYHIIWLYSFIYHIYNTYTYIFPIRIVYMWIGKICGYPHALCVFFNADSLWKKKRMTNSCGCPLNCFDY